MKASKRSALPSVNSHSKIYLPKLKPQKTKWKHFFPTSYRKKVLYGAALVAFLTAYGLYSNVWSSPTVPVCMFQIRNACNTNKNVIHWGWFHDNTKGGPTASSKQACYKRKTSWQETCPDGNIEMFFEPSWPEELLVMPDPSEPACKLKIIGNCKEFPSMKPSEWFLDEDMGGPKSTNYLECEKRKQSWEKGCGETTVDFDFSGPGQMLPGGDDTSWEFLDTDGAVITLTRTNDKKTTYKSCYDMSRKPALPAVPFVHFCYPTLNINGHPKAGTSALYYILQEHPNIKAAHSKKEYCRFLPFQKQEEHTSIFRYLYGFAAATENMGINDILVNGCINGLISPAPYLELDKLLKGPNALHMYVVRDAADRSWATYNFWCDFESEPDCPPGAHRKEIVHHRSAEDFHNSVLDNEPKKMLIANHAELSEMYTHYIKMMETMTTSKHVHVIASEKMKTNLVGVWEDFSKELKSNLNYDIPLHPKLKQLSEVRINENKKKESMLNETEKILRSWWDECDDVSKRTAWLYNCGYNRAYNRAKKFKGTEKTKSLAESYITLWMHQVHSWFAEDETETTASKVRAFISDAKMIGFTHLMFDLSWAWTEREAQGDVDIDSFSKRDVLSTACELGFSLNIVITMREFPPWMDDDDTFFEIGRALHQEELKTKSPSVAHPKVWKFATDFVKTTSELLLEKYGECIASISPSFNNEFETRYTQTYGKMRDYSSSSITAYKEFLIEKNLSSSVDSVVPPNFPNGPTCHPILDEDIHVWLGFREEFLANRYIELCKMIKMTGGRGTDGNLFHPSCLLHIGEFFTSTDSLNANLFFKLAKSEYVDHLVMDSNMALFGAPASPSIPGILVSVAQAYGKSIHYEAATERILHCDDNGKFIKENIDQDRGAPLLLESGILRALESGVHAIGVTNLCVPNALKSILSRTDTYQSDKFSLRSLMTASSFEPTAVIFVPYRAFYAYNFVISGAHCDLQHLPCWHKSFEEIPTFGSGSAKRKPGMCNVDRAQSTLVSVWDDLRTRHAQVAVIGDAEELTDELLESAKERVILRFPCVMTDRKWNFYEGDKTFESYSKKSRKYSFSEILIDMPGSCK